MNRRVAAAAILGLVPHPAIAQNDEVLVEHGLEVVPAVPLDMTAQWLHREFAYVWSGIQCVKDERRDWTPVPAVGLYLEKAEAGPTPSKAEATASVNVTTLQNDRIAAVLSAGGRTEAKRGPFPCGFARASAGSLFFILGDERLREAELKWKARVKAEAQNNLPPGGFGLGLGSGSRSHDPIVARRTDLTTGATTTHTLLATNIEHARGAVVWDNDVLASSAKELRFSITIDSPWTVQQGTLRIVVADGVVTESSKSGIFAAVPLPPVGFAGVLSIPLPTETTLNYDMGGSPSENLEVALAFDGAASREDADGSLTDNGAFITDLFHGFNNADTSQVEPPASIFGYNTFSSAFHLADDFTVTPGVPWQPSSLIMHLYQTNTTPADPITAAFVQIWNGPPGQGGQVIAGNMQTNHLMTSKPVSVYRVAGDPENNQRLLKEVMVDMSWSPPLPAGTYWVEFASQGNPAFTGPWAVPNSATSSTDNARILNVATGQWTPVIDPGSGQGADFPFAVFGSGPPPFCYPDCSLSGTLTVADFACFQNAFIASDPYADCNNSVTLTVADFICFQNAFITGCP